MYSSADIAFDFQSKFRLEFSLAIIHDRLYLREFVCRFHLQTHMSRTTALHLTDLDLIYGSLIYVSSVIALSNLNICVFSEIQLLPTVYDT